MAQGNVFLEELLLARDLVFEYHFDHKFITRKWVSVGAGKIERPGDENPAELEKLSAVIVNLSGNRGVSQRTRVEVDIILDIAGLDHIPVEYINVPEN